MHRYHFIAALAAAGLVAAPAAAATILVPADHPTIQGAIDAAVDGDQVIVAPGTYGESIDLLGKEISVRSSSGAASTTIDAGGTDVVVRCESGETAASQLIGFTITGGAAVAGAGLSVVSSNPSIVDCVFTGNVASNTGGAIRNFESSPTISGCQFVGNGANKGGAIHNLTGSPIISGCVFQGNTATGTAGAVLNNVDSFPKFTDCAFVDNVSAGTAGAVSNTNDSSPRYDRCLFQGNAAASVGGAVFNTIGGSPTFANCCFVDNTGTNGAAFHSSSSSNPVLVNCSIGGNNGDGIYGDGTTHVLVNCIVYGNSGLALAGAGTFQVSSSDVEGGAPGSGNIDVDPLFVDAGSGDLRLLAGSPAIDAGISVAAASDLDGNARVVDDPATTDTGVGFPEVIDLGAFEFGSKLPGCTADSNGDGIVDVSDLVNVILQWGECP